jgi:hypothetical protein
LESSWNHRFLLFPQPAFQNRFLYWGKWHRPAFYASGSEPLKSALPVRQSRGAVMVLHGCQHGPDVWHRSIKFVRNWTVNIA